MPTSAALPIVGLVVAVCGLARLLRGTQRHLPMPQLDLILASLGLQMEVSLGVPQMFSALAMRDLLPVFCVPTQGRWHTTGEETGSTRVETAPKWAVP